MQLCQAKGSYGQVYFFLRASCSLCCWRFVQAFMLYTMLCKIFDPFTQRMYLCTANVLILVSFCLFLTNGGAWITVFCGQHSSSLSYSFTLRGSTFCSSHKSCSQLLVVLWLHNMNHISQRFLKTFRELCSQLFDWICKQLKKFPPPTKRAECVAFTNHMMLLKL